MAQLQTQPMVKKSKRRIALAIVAIVIIVGAVAGFLFYGPSNVQMRIRDPPQSPYSSSITAIYITFSSIEVHTANAGNNSGWHTIVAGATINLFTVLNVSNTLGSSTLPAGKYTELRFNVSAVIITISGVNVTFTIPNGTFKVPILNGGFHAYGAVTVNVELDLSFNDSEIIANANGHLNPVATAKVV